MSEHIQNKVKKQAKEAYSVMDSISKTEKLLNILESDRVIHAD